MYIPLILLGVLLNAAAQLLLKQGMLHIGYFEFSLANIWPIFTKVALNPYIFLGLSAYVVSVGVWLLVLSRVEVSYAYPMLSIGYIVNAIAAYYLFHENLSMMRILGIALTVLGVYFISRTSAV
jgi:multidrug transporter EmrE-like cation transporter